MLTKKATIIGLLTISAFAQIHTQVNEYSLMWLDDNKPISSYTFYDIDKDGIDEVITTHERNHEVVIYKIDYLDTMRLVEVYSVSIKEPSFARIADLNNDGEPELIISADVRPPDSAQVFSSLTRGLFCVNVSSIAQNDTQLSYIPLESASSPFQFFDVLDFDGDGDNDLIGYDQKSTFWEVISDGDKKSMYGPSVSSRDVVLNDMDADGDIDVFFVNRELQWVENTKGIKGNPVQKIATPLSHYNLIDMDGDGDKDVLGFREHKDGIDTLCCKPYGNRPGDYFCVGWLENIGGFELDTFKILQHRLRENSMSIAIVDHDNDGQPSIFLNTQVSSASTTALRYEKETGRLIAEGSLFERNPVILGKGSLLDDLIEMIGLSTSMPKNPLEMDTYRRQKLKYFFPNGKLRFHDFDHDGDLDLFLTKEESFGKITGLFIGVR